LLPEVRAQADSQLRRLNAADAFGRLLAASATVTLEVLNHREQQLALLAQLADTSRAFELVLGQDFLLAPTAAATRLLAELAERDG
jgi:hypothetical protein